MVIGIDGCTPAGLQAANTPNLDALIADGTVTYDAFAGGVLGQPSEQRTISGPGWSSILTGVWVDKHNVRDNSFSSPNFANYPHFFTRIKQHDPSMYLASISQWSPINTYIVPNADTDLESTTGSAASLVSQAATVLATEDSDVVFLHFGDVDGAGHSYGFSTSSANYLAAIEGVDTHIGTVVSAIKNRPNYDNEDWLILVTTDHGGTPGGSHDGQSTENRTIFIIANGDAVCTETISPGPGLTAIAPTVMRHLGIAVNPAWGWEDDAFGSAPPPGDLIGPAGRPDCEVNLLDLSIVQTQYLELTL